MKNTTLKMTLISTFITLFSLSISAGEKHEMMIKKMQQHLSLSDEQVVQIQDIKASYQPKFQSLRSSSQLLRKQLREVMKDDTPDEDTIRSINQQLADTRSEKMLLKKKMKNDVDTILTAEQQAKRDELRAKRKEIMKQKRQHKRWHKHMDKH